VVNIEKNAQREKFKFGLKVAKFYIDSESEMDKYFGTFNFLTRPYQFWEREGIPSQL
jgi:hypothetical protein